jgi:hypothetical protein
MVSLKLRMCGWRIILSFLTPFLAALSLGSVGLLEETRKTETGVPSERRVARKCVHEPQAAANCSPISNGKPVPPDTSELRRANMVVLEKDEYFVSTVNYCYVIKLCINSKG